MPHYAALLRGVSPMNCKMPALRAAFEAAGFTDVVTVISSGNVVFGARKASEESLRRRAEQAMQEHMGKSFSTIVRPIAALRVLLAADPFTDFELAPGAKRIVTFLRAAPENVSLPLQSGDARLVTMRGLDLLGAYVPSPGDPAFMRLIERNFGKDITTRTWDTVKRIVAAAPV